MIPRSYLDSKDSGFLVNGEVKIVVTVVVGKADVVLVESKDESEEKFDEQSEDESDEEFKGESKDDSEEASSPLKKTKLNDGGAVPSDLHNEAQQGKETMNIHGFHVLPSQVKFVSRIFKKYPDTALEFRAKSQHLRTACMNVLLSLIKTLCQSPQELSNEDMVEADNALAYMKDAGFKVDWLENAGGSKGEEEGREDW